MLNDNGKLNIVISVYNKDLDKSIYLIDNFLTGYNDSTLFLDFGGELFASTGDTEIEMIEVTRLEKRDLEYEISYADLTQKINVPRFRVIVSIGITDRNLLKKYQHLSGLIPTLFQSGKVYTSIIVVDASLKRKTFDEFELILN